MPELTGSPRQRVEQLYYPDELDAWGDGLPLVPPVEWLVEEALSHLDVANPDAVYGRVPVSGADLTPRLVAANAVMAGAPPEAMPVVWTAVRAAMSPEFNLTAILSTTHPCGVMVVVHGSGFRELGFNAGVGALGPGNRLNATVGRAVRLSLMNIAGARPGGADRATHGQPGKFSFCFAENTEASPWPSYGQRSPYGADVDAVTVHAGEAPTNVNDHRNDTAAGVLRSVAATVAVGGNNNVHLMKGGEVFVLLGPEHANTICDDGFGIPDAQLFLFEVARLPLEMVRNINMAGLHTWPAWLEAYASLGPSHVPVVPSPDAFRILTVGGPGKHSMAVPGFGYTTSVTLSCQDACAPGN